MKQNFNEVLTLQHTSSRILTAIAVTETWLTGDTQDLYTIPGYKFVSQPTVNKIDDGVGLLIKTDFKFEIRYQSANDKHTPTAEFLNNMPSYSFFVLSNSQVK